MRILIIVFLFANIILKAQTGQYVPELNLFDSKMNDIMIKYKIHGGQLAITYQGRLVYSRGFGLADTLDNSLVQPKSIFRLASVSKSITSIAIMKLVENGLLNLDEKVLGSDGIIKDSIFQIAKDVRMYDFTVRQLLNHSAGFNFDYANEPLWRTFDIAKDIGVTPPVNSFELVLKWTLKNKSLGFAPGTAVSYSNFGYVLLGFVIEKITGKKYEDFVRDSILIPLGITDMYAGRTLKIDKYPNEVSYYNYFGEPLATSIYTGIPKSVPPQYGGYNWEIMTAAGGWVTSAQDLCKLLVALDRFTTKSDILLPSTIDTMTKKSENWPAYALGWFVDDNSYWNTGGIEGTATVIKRDGLHQINYAILFNTLPDNYTPFYNEFMHMVSNEFANIKSWPSHDFFIPSSTNDNDIPNEIYIYTNPSFDYLVISENIENAGLFNSLGICLWKGNIEENQRIDISNFKNGVYFLKTKYSIRKFLITR